MAYTLDFGLALGSSKAGLADLRAQVVDTAGSDVGAAASTGFVEIGQGYYLWHYAAFPDGQRGGVKFYSNAAPTVFLAFVALNPEEAENTDAKVTTRLASGTVAADVTAILADTGATLPASIAALPTGADVLAQAEAALVSTDAAIAAVKVDTAAILLDTGTDGVVLANNAITAAKIATDAIGSDELATTATAEIAAAAWAYVTRTLTTTAAATTAAVTGSTLALTARATYTATLSGLTISAAWEKIWFTIKRVAADADSASIVQIVETNPAAGTDGLLYLNGAAATAANASLTIDQAAGTIVISITDDTTSVLSAATALVYDIKQLVSGATTQLTTGAASVTTGVTAAIA